MISKYKRKEEHKSSTKAGIYCILNKINNKKYIGQTYDLHYRWNRHRSDLNCQRHSNKHLQSSWNIYGEDAFEYIVLEYCSLEIIDEKEKYWINYYDSIRTGYNQAKGGLGCRGYKHTDEEIAKMRMIQKPKKVVQFDLNGNYIKTWISGSCASKELGLYSLSIKNCCNKKNHVKSVGGYIWTYEEDKNDLSYYLKKNIALPKRVNQYDKKLNFIKTWDSIYQIGKELNYSTSQISMCCNKKNKSAYGYVWIFEKDSKNIDVNFYKESRGRIPPKKVNQYDKNMNLIKTWNSVSQVEKETSWKRGQICNCCNGKANTAYGYIWRYVLKST